MAARYIHTKKNLIHFTGIWNDDLDVSNSVEKTRDTNKDQYSIGGY